MHTPALDSYLTVKTSIHRFCVSGGAKLNTTHGISECPAAKGHLVSGTHFLAAVNILPITTFNSY